MSGRGEREREEGGRAMGKERGYGRRSICRRWGMNEYGGGEFV
jgi:hypothetical protein